MFRSVAKRSDVTQGRGFTMQVGKKSGVCSGGGCGRFCTFGLIPLSPFSLIDIEQQTLISSFPAHSQGEGGSPSFWNSELFAVIFLIFR